uniref:Uncharacterized protein n=1 Tax=Nelumbo nucifera TaxID=4432 RepID=A0A822ZC13_NELNU|nr:TPA_asm: hypothetical protein HUJ06_015332 [Nelumbo nucifera]
MEPTARVVEGESGGERFHGPLIDWKRAGGGTGGGREWWCRLSSSLAYNNKSDYSQVELQLLLLLIPQILFYIYASSFSFCLKMK